ncbi:MAG: hypothetical protein Q8K26_00410, partial [Candidatus Gracilibacteria bacterium]|nr:hypothetical protein [Candidatus Gracilibacteria bacterium]
MGIGNFKYIATKFAKLSESEKLERYEQDKILAEEMNKRVNDILALQEISNTTETVSENLECEFEKSTFRVDSIDWNEEMKDGEVVMKNGHSVLVNPEGDIWEYVLPNGQSEQLLTPVAMLREVTKAGRLEDVPNEQQAGWLVKNMKNISDSVAFAGSRDPATGEIMKKSNACIWTKTPSSRDSYKALFCVDINTVDEEMRPYTNEIMLEDYD